jgi:hypothetical protein
MAKVNLKPEETSKIARLGAGSYILKSKIETFKEILAISREKLLFILKKN